MSDDDADDDGGPGHLQCYACYSMPAGRVEQCANGHFLCAQAGRAWQILLGTSYRAI